MYLREIAGVISLSAYGLYIISTFRGKAKPSRSTWWILTLIGILTLSSSYAIGATENVWMMLVYIIGPFIIAVQSLSPKYGYSSGLLPIDIVCIVSALVCASIWLIFRTPLIAFLGSIVIDCIALIPTIRKAYSEPQEEDPLAWGIEIVASIVNAIGITVWFSVTERDWIYALYLLLGNGIIFLLLLLSPHRKRST